MLSGVRTTITLDDDVAAIIEGRRKANDQSLKEIINDAPRKGLRPEPAARGKRKVRATRSVDLGRCLLDNVDDIAETLSIAEGESCR